MIRFTILLVFVFINYFGFTQDSDKNKKNLTREEKRELSNNQELEVKKFVAGIIQERKYVIEASNIQNKSGQTFPVSSTINFIKIDSLKAVFQFGSANTAGVNGVGGLTIDGSISTYEEKKQEKSESFYIHLVINSTKGRFDIVLDITAMGMTNAMVKAPNNSYIEYSGRINSIEKSHIFKGQSH